MAVSFNYIPAGNGVRVPLFYAEMDASQAGYFSQPLRTLLIGHKLSGGNASLQFPYLVTSTDQAKALFGRGSMLARMHAIYRLSDPVGEVWCIAATAPTGDPAEGTITVTASGVAAGTISLYIAAQRLQIAVAAGASANTIASAINTAINAAADLPVTSTVSTNEVTVTARWDGLTGNDIEVQHTLRGQTGGEALPVGVTLAIVQPTGGTGAPDLTGVITAMGDEEYDFVIHPFTDTASLDDLQTEFGDASGRWSWSRQIYGHAYTALRGDASGLVSAGNARNDPHHTIAAIDADCPHPNWEYAAAYGARNAVFIAADPARPTQTGELTGLLVPRESRRFLWSERNTLLSNGIATSFVGGGVLRIERAITTYQLNAYDQPDPSYLDSETLHQNAYVLRYLRSAVTTKYGRHKLANDGTRFGAGQAIVTPNVIRGELYAAYKTLEELGIVENFEAFKAALIVERNSVNPNRVNVLYPPDLINQLRVFAVLNQFRLQYPTT